MTIHAHSRRPSWPPDEHRSGKGDGSSDASHQASDKMYQAAQRSDDGEAIVLRKRFRNRERMRVYGIGLDFVIEAIGRAFQRFAQRYLPDPAHQRLQQRSSRRGRMSGASSRTRYAKRYRTADWPRRQRPSDPTAAAHHRLGAGDKLDRFERLAEIVVGTGIQRLGDVARIIVRVSTRMEGRGRNCRSCAIKLMASPSAGAGPSTRIEFAHGDRRLGFIQGRDEVGTAQRALLRVRSHGPNWASSSITNSRKFVPFDALLQLHGHRCARITAPPSRKPGRPCRPPAQDANPPRRNS